MIEAAYSTGFTVGLSLILAIGAQNAFVLRQGLRNEHVLAVALTCATSDAALILFGVSGFRQILMQAPWIDPLLRYAGASFLFWYGARSMVSAVRSKGALAATDISSAGLHGTLLSCLALTWLNPHVYLDTVLLIGTLSTQFPGREFVFAAGASTASFFFFFSLAFGAFYIRPLFAKPISWRVLEGAIAFIMWSIATKLVIGL